MVDHPKNISVIQSTSSYDRVLIQIAQQNQSQFGDFVVVAWHFVSIPFRTANEPGRKVLIQTVNRMNQLEDQQKFW